MQDITIYHNPGCSNSRGALKLLREAGIEPDIRLYLVDPPSPDELKEVLAKLGIQAEALLRKKEPLYKEGYEGKELSENQWIGIMSENPVLIERPVVIGRTGAIIARPPEKVADFLASSKAR